MPQKAEFALVSGVDIGREFQHFLIRVAPPKASHEVVCPRTEQGAAHSGGCALVACAACTEVSDLLDEARPASEVGVEQRFGRGMQLCAHRVESLLAASAHIELVWVRA